MLPDGRCRSGRRAEILHVRANGDDAGDGSDARPLKTIAATQRRIRQLPAGSRLGTASISAVVPSRYPSHWSSRRPIRASRRASHHLCRWAVSAADRIAGFRPDGKQWVARVPASLPPFRDLWVNGRRAVRGRPTKDSPVCATRTRQPHELPRRTDRSVPSHQAINSRSGLHARLVVSRVCDCPRSMRRNAVSIC